MACWSAAATSGWLDSSWRNTLPKGAQTTTGSRAVTVAGASALADDGDLSEEVAGAEDMQFLTVLGDGRPALIEDVEGVPGLSFADQGATGVVLLDVEVLGEGAPVVD